MTDKPTPKEIDDLVYELRQAGKDDTYSLVCAVLAKWGQPVVAGDVDRADAVNLARNALTQYDCAITKKGVRVLAEAVLSMDSALTTPQPTQAQAAEPVAWLDPWTGTKVTTDYDAYGKHGIPLVRQQPVARVPLTPERVKEIVRGAGYDQCGIPDTERSAFINGLRQGEREHGIKGGQRG